MTLRPMYRKCPKCKKTYTWNPDVGKMFCPRCGRFDFIPLPGTTPEVYQILERIFKEKK